MEKNLVNYNLDIPFKEFMAGQIIDPVQFNDDMAEIEEKVNEIVGKHNSLNNSAREHIANKDNPHEVTAHQVGTYTGEEIDGFVDEIKKGGLNPKSIKNEVLADNCVDSRTIANHTITASKVDSLFGGQIDISKNTDITDRYTKTEVDTLIKEKVGEGAYSKEEIDKKFQEVQAGQIVDKTIGVDKLKDDVGTLLDISANKSITDRYTKEEVDVLVRENGLPRDWGGLEEIVEKQHYGYLPVANVMTADEFIAPSTPVLDIDVREVVGARGSYDSLKERLNNVDLQLEHIAINVKNFGVKGDGINDDTFALNNILNRSNSTIIFPNGDYKITGNLNIQVENLILDGQGSTIKGINCHGFDLKPTAKNIVIKNFNFDFEYVPGFSNACIVSEKKNETCGEYESSCNIIIENCTFNGSVFGIFLNSSTNVNVNNCKFNEHYFVESDVAGGYAILLQSCYHVNIRDNYNVSGETNRHFVYVSVDRTKTNNISNKNITVENNYIDFSKNQGLFGTESAIVIRECDTMKVLNNYVKQSFGGVYINSDFSNYGCNNILIQGNRFESIREVKDKFTRACIGNVSIYTNKNLIISDNYFNNVNITQAIQLKDDVLPIMKNNTFIMSNDTSKVYNLENVVNFIIDGDNISGNRSHNIYYVGTNSGKIVNLIKDDKMYLTEFATGGAISNTTRDIQRMIKVYRDVNSTLAQLKLNFEGLVSSVVYETFGFTVKFNYINVENMIFTYMQTFGELAGLSVRSVNSDANSVSFNVNNASTETKTGQWNIYF